jgi:hypothetical protein
MTRLAEEIDALVARRTAERPQSFAPVLARRHRIAVRRRLAATGALAVVAAAVAVGNAASNSGHKATPTAPDPYHLPPLAGTVWSIDALGNDPASDVTGSSPVDSTLNPRITFATDTEAIVSDGSGAIAAHVEAVTGWLTFDLGATSGHWSAGSGEVLLSQLRQLFKAPLTPTVQGAGTVLEMATADGETMTISRLDPVGPYGRVGDLPWALRSVTGPNGTLSVDPALHARLTLTSVYSAEFSVGANTDIVSLSAGSGVVQFGPEPFTHQPARPGEAAVTDAITEFGRGEVTVKASRSSLQLTSANGQVITLVR